jgi:tetratricopeptide (TPR) repeat protein
MFRDLLHTMPDNAGLLADLALALCEQRRFDDVLPLCAQALAIDRATVGAHVAMSLALTAADRLDEAEAACRRAIELAPDALEPRINLAVCQLEKNQRHDVIETCAAVLAREPNCQEARWNLGLAQLALGRFAEGWENYEARKHRGYGGADRQFAAPLWDGSASLEGRTILLHAEQGLGDTLQFVRYVPLAAEAGATVLLEVQPPLRTLLQSVEGVTAVFARGEPLPACDFQIPLLSLPHAFRTRLESIPAVVPYLRAAPDKAAQWHERLGEGRRIGLVWSGNPVHGRDVRRSIPFAVFSALTARIPARFVSLQKDLRPADAVALKAQSQIADLSSELGNFSDAAAVVSALDLVITVDTAMAHLAGAMGRPVWVLLPFAADWRWLTDRTDSPWYPTARLFRQSMSERWEPVIEEVGAALRDWAARPAAGSS